MTSSTNLKCRAKGGVAACKDPNCPERRSQRVSAVPAPVSKKEFAKSFSKTVPVSPDSIEAWQGLANQPWFQRELKDVAMSGYRSHDVSTQEEAVELAQRILAYKHSESEIDKRTIQILRAHHGAVASELKPMVKTLFIRGWL